MGRWFIALHAELARRGVDADALFRAAGLNVATLQPTQSRVTLAQSRQIWDAAVESTGDPALGLAVAQRASPGTFHALAFAVLASATLGQALERIVRYFRVVTDAAELQLETHPDRLRLRIQVRPHDTAPADAAVDALFAVLIQAARTLLSTAFAPLALHLTRPEPADLAPYRRCFGPHLHFAARELALDIALHDAQRPLPMGNEDLAAHNDHLLQRWMADTPQASTTERVIHLLRRTLSDGEPGQDHVASTLGMSLRQLQRKLQQEGRSYRVILDDTRSALADRHLPDARLSISEVAWLLGFADSGSFSRSFRRWHGLSPREWRAQHLNLSPSPAEPDAPHDSSAS